MKRAFTLFEVILVIVVIGILAAVVLPRLKSDRLNEAADLFINTLRYAQHLAMVDDKYIADTSLSPYPDAVRARKSVKQWYKQWWTFWVWKPRGGTVATCNNRRGPGIAVFSDSPTNNGNNNLYNHKPDLSEVAIDPKTGERIVACISGNTQYINDDYNLFERFGIVKVDINNSTCGNTRTHLMFDELGRPQCSYTRGSNSLIPYQKPITTRVKYTLCADTACTDSVSVCVEPVTGYIHRCN